MVGVEEEARWKWPFLVLEVLLKEELEERPMCPIFVVVVGFVNV